MDHEGEFGLRYPLDVPNIKMQRAGARILNYCQGVCPPLILSAWLTR
jgi:hypothetical protein